HPLQYVLHVSRGEGYSQFAGLPVLCQTQYPMEKGDYENLQKRPWPEGQIHTTVAKKSPEEHDAEVKIAAQEQLASLLESFGLQGPRPRSSVSPHDSDGRGCAPAGR